MQGAVQAIGISIVVFGLLIEFVAFFAMAFYPVRRAIPLKSPMLLQSVGCATFVVGVVIIVVGKLTT